MHEIHGTAFAPDLADGRVSGAFHVDDEAIRLRHADGDVTLPRDGLQLRVDGNVERFAHLTHPARPGVDLMTGDFRLFEHPSLQADATFVAQLEREARGARAEVRRFRMVVAATVLGLAALVVIVLLAGGRLAGWALERIPPTLERQLGEAVFTQLASNTAQHDDAVTRRALETLIAPLRDAAPDEERDHYPFTVHVFDDPTVNAFALPGGIMILNRGLILAADDPHELLGVVAHERAHVVARHSLRNLVRDAGVWIALRTIVGDPGGLASIVSEGGAALLGQAYSRDLEREADDHGWQLMIDAGLDPDGLLRFLETLREEVPDPSIPGFLSTHPPTDERLERLMALPAPASTTTEPALVEAFATLQQQLR